MNFKRIIGIILLIFLMLNVAVSAGEMQLSILASASEENSLCYRLRKPYVGTLTYTLKIETNYANTKITSLCIPLIRNETARHYVILNNISPTPSEIQRDNYENLYAYWDEKTLPKQQSFTVNINYNVLSFEVNYPIDADSVLPYDKNSTVYKNFTEPETFIESDSGLLNSTAHTIAGDDVNPHEIAHKIYQYVIDTQKYEVQPEEHGAVWALQYKKGDCSEFSYLFVALCRAMGIPAKIKVGYALQSDTQSEENGHMWAEYYIENYGWIPVDTTWHLFDKIDQYHFDTLQSKPSLENYDSYSNYQISYSGQSPSDKLTVKLSKASSEILQNFPYGQTLYDIVSTMQKTDFMFNIVRWLGASILFASDFDTLEQARNNADLYIRGAETSWSLSSDTHLYLQQAQANAEQAYTLARTLLLKIIIIIIIVLVVVSVVLVVVLMKKQKEKMMPTKEAYGFSQVSEMKLIYVK